MVARRSALIFTSLAIALVAADPVPTREPYERRPYAIAVHLAIDPAVRLDPKGRKALVDDWQSLIRRFVGAPWAIELADGEGPLAGRPVDAIEAGQLAEAARGRDKVWLIRVGPSTSGAGWTCSGREFDAATGHLGSTVRREAIVPTDAPRALFELALAMFAPTAEIGESSAGGVGLTVQGGAIAAADPVGQVLKPGTIFRPFREFREPDGTTFRIDPVRWTYLPVESIDGATARCAIVSGLRDPLTRRVARKNVLRAIGVRPSENPTRLRFVTEPGARPAAGYVLAARLWPNGNSTDLTTTDREGRVVLEPGVLAGLSIFRLLAAGVEPMVEFPAMPGESPEERTIPFVPKPETVELEARLGVLGDAILDQVAIRSRLERRLKARAEGGDWADVEAALDEFARLPGRTSYVARLDALRDEAQARQAAAKVAILTKTAQAQIAETRSLIERYLDDEPFRAYAEALERARADAAKPKAKAKARPPG